MKKLVLVLIVLSLILFSCGDDNGSGPSQDLPEAIFLTNFNANMNELFTQASNSTMPNNFSDLYGAIFSDVGDSLFNRYSEFLNVMGDFLDTARYSDGQWTATISFGGENITMYGSFEGDLFWIRSEDDPAGTGGFFNPANQSLYLIIDGDDSDSSDPDIKAHLYKPTGSDYYYGYVLIRATSSDDGILVKFKYEDVNPPTYFIGYGGDYQGSSSVINYPLISDYSGTAEDWYNDESDADMRSGMGGFRCTYDSMASPEFTYQYLIVM